MGILGGHNLGMAHAFLYRKSRGKAISGLTLGAGGLPGTLLYIFMIFHMSIGQSTLLQYINTYLEPDFKNADSKSGGRFVGGSHVNSLDALPIHETLYLPAEDEERGVRGREKSRLIPKSWAQEEGR